MKRKHSDKQEDESLAGEFDFGRAELETVDSEMLALIKREKQRQVKCSRMRFVIEWNARSEKLNNRQLIQIFFKPFFTKKIFLFYFYR